MTDLERFVELYKSFGIDCKVLSENSNHLIILSEFPYGVTDNRSTVSEKFKNYGSYVWFGLKGNFLGQEFYER